MGEYEATKMQLATISKLCIVLLYVLSLLLFYREIMITDISMDITFEELKQEMRGICRFHPEQVFTMKWVDEEGFYLLLCYSKRLGVF